jgi:hypothetical protein
MQVDTTQRKNKSRQSTKTKQKPYANRTHGKELKNDNQW